MKNSILAIVVLIIVSCSNSDDQNQTEEPIFDGSIEDIEAFYNPEIVDALNDLGFVFRVGNNPLNIEGTYTVSPSIIEASTTGIDSLGTRLADQIVILSNQNNDSLTIDIRIEGNGQTSFGKGSFISGNESEFSIFTKSETQNNNSIAVETATSITGKISDEGIIDFQFAGLMLNDNGDPDDRYIENNTGRLISDGDNISPKSSISSKTQISGNSEKSIYSN